MRNALTSVLISLAACRAVPSRAVDVPPARMPEAPPSAPTGAPRPLPAVTDLMVHLPGADPHRFANLSVHIDGMPWTMTGCVSSGRGSCIATRRVDMTPDDRGDYVRHWQAIFAMGRCEARPSLGNDRLFVLTSSGGGTYEDPLPADAAQVAARTAEPCAAPARLAVWAVRRFGAMP